MDPKAIDLLQEICYKKCLVAFETIIYVLYFPEFISVVVTFSLHTEKSWKSTNISAETEVLVLW